MGNKRIIGVVLLVVGVILLYFGYQATSAPTESLRHTFNGDYSNQTMLYLIGGGAAAVAGLAMLFMGAKR